MWALLLKEYYQHRYRQGIHLSVGHSDSCNISMIKCITMAMQWPSSGGGYDDLRSKMEGCGGAEKFWSFGSKLPYVPPYKCANRPSWRVLPRALRRISE